MLARSRALSTLRRAQRAALLAPTVIVFVLDHITKWFVSGHLLIGETTWSGGPFVFRHVENSGAAFGVASGLTWLYPIVAVVVAIAIVGWGHRFAPKLWQQAVLGLILGGALSNAVDRVAFKHVTDFIDFRWWPVFNVADIAIVLGIAIAIFLFRPPEKH